MSSTDVKPVKWFPQSEAEYQTIREELARILGSAPFSTSKRYPALLRYTVEKTLRGDTECLKERTIGIDVFRRDPQYDTNADPVVRIAAGEVRKRLARYYYDSTYKHEVHIELPPGTYVAEFYRRGEASLTGERQEDRHNPAGTESTERMSAIQTPQPAAAGSDRWRVLAPIFFLLLGSCLGAIGARVHSAVASTPTALDEFWSPLISAPGTVWLCVGEAYVTGIQLEPNGARNRFGVGYKLSSSAETRYPALNLADTTVLAHVAGLLQTRNKNYSVHGETETAFSDLAGGPSVLIGSFNNDWAVRLTDQLRFHFEINGGAGEQWIVDSDKPTEKIGLHTVGLSSPDTEDAYAIISRVHDPGTGQMVVSLAGVSTKGTIAAGTFVSDPRYFEEFAKTAPRRWQNGNLQIVIAAPIVDGSLGPPHVVSSYVW